MKVGDPGRPSTTCRHAAHAAGAQRGDRPDHGRHHRARGGPARRAGAGRAVRPAQGRGQRDRQPATKTDRAKEPASDDARSPCSAPGRGARRSRSCSPTPATRSMLWARREEVARRDQRDAREPRLPARHRAARRDLAPPRRRGGGRRRRHRRARRRRRRRCAPTSPSGRRSSPTDAVLVSLMKGVELGTLKRMSEVIARGHRCRPRAHRRRQRPQPGPGDRPARAGRLGGGVRRRGRGAKRLQGRCHSPAFRPYTSIDVLGCEIGGAYKNVVGLAVGMAVGLGFGDNTTASRDHPRARRDRPAGDGARRRPADADGPRRARRPRRHLLLAAVAQPHLRREARPGHDDRGDLRLDPPGRRGRQVLRVAARAGPTAPASTRRSPSTSTPSSPAR